MQDALGNSIGYTYDGAGNLLTVTDEEGVTRSYTYDRVGNVLTYTDGLGRTTAYAYDKNYNLIRTTDPAGAVTGYEYDAMGRVVKETDVLGNSQTFTYDKNGRIIKVTDKNGNSTDYTLDGNGNILCQTDAAGHPSYFEYDSMNRLVKMTLYAGEETGADKEPILTGEQITLYTYDHRGLVTTQINAAGDGKYYVYDELGNLISTTDEDGYVTSNSYDALNRLAETDYNGSKQAGFLYNGTGELVEMTDWNGVTTIRRDLLNRIEEVKDHNGRTTDYAWDAVGRLTSITYPGGMGTAVFTYDAEGNQLTATDRNGKTFTFTYDETDNLTSKRYPNGEMERYQYDAAHQLLRMDEYDLNGKQKTYTEYTYDAAGNRTGDCNRVPTTPTVNYAYTGNKGTWGGEWNTYTYDALNRLVKEYEHDTALTILYAYDSLGNKTYEKNSSNEKYYTYNELNQLVAKEAYNRTTHYEYDKRGNRILETSINTQENRRTYEWDETNRLIKGTRGPDYGLYTSEYTYNGLGLRVNSTIMGPDKTIYDRDYVIDYTRPERNDLAEFNLGRYQWQGDKKVHDLTHLYNGAGQRLQTESTRYVDWAGTKSYTRYIHEDIMGSSYYYTNPETGYVTNKHEYTTWGNNTKAPTYNYDPEYRASEPYFTGHPYDGSLNLYYAEARFYDPETGSFLSSDPAKSGLNWYQYCGSNPTTYVDVLGLEIITLKEMDVFFFNKLEDSQNNYSLGLMFQNRLMSLKEVGVINVDNREKQVKFMLSILEGAVVEYIKTGIPWQVTMAQAAQETGWGDKTPIDIYSGRNSNNLFGIKYFGLPSESDDFVRIWTTEYVKQSEVGYWEQEQAKWSLENEPLINTGVKDAEGNIKIEVIQPFRAYENAGQSLLDHSKTLGAPIYAEAEKYSNDPLKYIEEIAEHYATDSQYSENITIIMNKYLIWEGKQ